MEIQIYAPTQGQPLPPVQWNYPEVKQWVQDGLARYNGVVYGETQIAQAKSDRANLNKLATAIDAKRKEMKSLYLEPYAEFESQAKELTEMIKAQVAEIDNQVKAFDNSRKEEKLEQIKVLYAEVIGVFAELIPYDRIHNPRWLNVTMSMEAIRKEMAATVEKVNGGFTAIESMNLAPDVALLVREKFMENFDLAAAIAEKVKIETRRAEYERCKAEKAAKAAQSAQEAHTAAENYHVVNSPVEAKTSAEAKQCPDMPEEIYTVTFRIHATKAQIDALGAFMKTNNIKPERV